MNIKTILKNGCDELSIELTERQIAAFMDYLTEFQRWSGKINLTAIKREEEIIKKHFLDSLLAWKHLKKGGKVLDIGTGGGLPGIPLKIVLPEIELTLIDSVGKKIVFLKNIIRKLELQKTEALHGRAEDRLLIRRFNHDFDIILTRAFSDLSEIADLSTPYIKKGGHIIAYKGPLTETLRDEAQEVVSRIDSLKLVRLEEHKIPLSDRKTTLVIFKAT